MNYAPSEIFGIQVELLYEQKGSAAKDATDQYEEFTVETTDYKWMLNYLTLPMMAKVSFGSGARFFIEAGPYFGYLLSAKMKGTAKFMNPTNPDQNHTDDVDTDIYDSFKKFDFGLVGGIGVKVPAGSNMMVFGDARYNYGLAKLDSDGNAKMFNSAIGISVGVLFDISK